MDIWQILMTPFSWLLKQFCVIFDSYAIALILFTIVVKLILFPFSLKAKKEYDRDESPLCPAAGDSKEIPQ